MYELTCPSCGHVAKLPFVREGASAVCAKCGARFVIAAGHVRRPPPPPGHAPAARPAPAAEAQAERRVDEAGQVIGLSGLSEMMKREAGRSPAATPPTPARPAATVPAPAPAPAGVTPRPTRMLRSTRLLILLLLGVLAVLAFSGVLVWYNAQQRAERPAADALQPR